MTAAPYRTPVTIITGFLGSGKTTLLNRLLQDPACADAAVIINEFGEIALDHLLVATPAESITVLANGCVCCAMRGDLVATLRELYRKRRDETIPRFGRVLVETTGLADPVPILQTLITDAEIAPLFRLDGVATLVDAIHGETQLDNHPEAVKQAALADRLIVTKSDRASVTSVGTLRARLARLNPGADLFLVINGAIEPDRLFGSGVADAIHATGVARWLNAERYPRAGTLRDEYDGHQHRHHDSTIHAFCIYRGHPVTAAGLVIWLNLLAGLRGSKLLRVKGLLNVEGKPVVVHAVQTLIDEPMTLDRWPDADRRSRLVFITRDLPRGEIERTLGALDYAGASAFAAESFDAAAYARFVQAAGGFR
jgi:G3E family GTPase